MNLIHRLKSGWTALKFLKVGLGSLILYSSVESGEVSGIILGCLFLTFSLFTDGVCCGAACSYRPVNKINSSTIENTDYEVVVAK